mmetsp:Transcript_47176/g.94420  ORF Transcript_47176/g.94420 Transcript_47176/m.94420 type:complete len:96 (+) Transcript_47176:312-599(+)
MRDRRHTISLDIISSGFLGTQDKQMWRQVELTEDGPALKMGERTSSLSFPYQRSTRRKEAMRSGLKTTVMTAQRKKAIRHATRSGSGQTNTRIGI